MDVPTGPTGATGAAGTAATITVSGTSTGLPGSLASVQETVTPTGASLFFSIPAGPTGPVGSAFLSAYGAFVSNTVRTVTAGGQVILDAQSAGRGVSFTSGSSAVTIATAGVYVIDYSVRTVAGTGATIHLLVNGTAAANSNLVLETAASQATGFTILSLAAGDTVSIGVTGTNVTLAGGTNAFLNLLCVA
ncbi:MAG: hypothetical protein LIO58_08505 [Oscillospiraceae bacterium]|nr:hypothetical protein [Oscillospiraceae bacterium]